MDRRGDEQDDEERQQLAGWGRVAAVKSIAWSTVDGLLGLSGEESVACARRFFRWGFVLLPFLWAVNCFYFWPVLKQDPSPPSYFNWIRPHVVRSAVWLHNFLCTPHFLGPDVYGWRGATVWPIVEWNNLVMYSVADKLGLTGWT